MYVFDDYSDIEQYATFKAEVDKSYFMHADDEDFNMNLGQITPQHFPSEIFVEFLRGFHRAKVPFSFHRQRS